MPQPITAPPPPDRRPGPDPCAHLWNLDPRVVQLNHGSYGATPSAITARQNQVRDHAESELTRFFVEELEDLLDENRRALGAFIGAPPDHLAFVSNATEGVNAVIGSFDLEPGDELLVSSMEYPSCKRAFELAAERAGASVVYWRVPWPVASVDRVVDALMEQVTPKTRVALVSHVISTTAMVLPIERIVRELSARGVETLVDGAHAAGMLPLRVESVGAAWYTGNLHKWLCAPKGAGFLHVRPDMRDRVRPALCSLVDRIPRRTSDPFRLEFDYQGTRDYTPWTVVKDTIAHMESAFDGGWDAIRSDGVRRALRARDTLCECLNVAPPTPDEMVGSMAALPLPAPGPNGIAVGGDTLYHDPLHDALVKRWGIQLSVTPYTDENNGGAPARLVRVSMAPYVGEAQVEYLADALRVELDV